MKTIFVVAALFAVSAVVPFAAADCSFNSNATYLPTGQNVYEVSNGCSSSYEDPSYSYSSAYTYHYASVSDNITGLSVTYGHLDSNYSNSYGGSSSASSYQNAQVWTGDSHGNALPIIAVGMTDRTYTNNGECSGADSGAMAFSFAGLNQMFLVPIPTNDCSTPSTIALLP